MMKSYNDFSDEEDSDYDMSHVSKYYEEKDSVNTIDHVEDNIYIGDYRGASDLEKLEELNIKKIVSIGLPRERIFYKRFESIEYLDLNIADSERENIISHIDTFVPFMKGNVNVLIHCYAGISRSSAVVIAYLMKEKNMGYLNAYLKLKHKRNIINPNIGFVNQLVAMEYC